MELGTAPCLRRTLTSLNKTRPLESKQLPKLESQHHQMQIAKSFFHYSLTTMRTLAIDIPEACIVSCMSCSGQELERKAHEMLAYSFFTGPEASSKNLRHVKFLLEERTEIASMSQIFGPGRPKGTSLPQNLFFMCLFSL